MTFKPPFPAAAREYIRVNMDRYSRSELAYKITCLFGYPCTKEGVKGIIRQLKKEGEAAGITQPSSSSSSSGGCIASH